MAMLECPVCGEVIPLRDMNSHIDKCLVVKTPDTTKPKASPDSNLSTERKRQSLLSFGSPSPSNASDIHHTHSKKRKMDDEADKANMVSLETPGGYSGKPMATTLPAPLADVVRPAAMDGFVGQEGVTAQNSFLCSVLQTGEVPSLIFWGPPGCGKTTLARIIANSARKTAGSKFIQLSATTSGIADVKEAVKVAKNFRSLFKKKTILFIDEIHRFNKLQQDTFLPHVENGTITLLGATTENPSFQLNSALLSRCRVIVLEKLSSADVTCLLNRALAKLDAFVVTDKEQVSTDEGKVWISREALGALADLADGDARSALNGLQLAVQTKRTSLNTSLVNSEISKHKETQVVSNVRDRDEKAPKNDSIVSIEDVKICLQRTHLLYDRGDQRYHCISALHKSMRGSDANASLYWLARMLCAGEDPLYVARRVINFASEDVGLADPGALPQAVAAFHACQCLGMPACEVNLSQAVLYMARAPKSIEVYAAYGKAKSCVLEHEGPLPSVPLHLRNASTKLMRNLGYGVGYKYNPAFIEPVDQTYLPDELKSVDFFVNS